MENQAVTAAGRWSSLEARRAPFLDRAMAASSLTIPTLIPNTDISYTDEKNAYINSLYQGVGARCVNGLAAKLLMVLLPPNQPFLRLVINKKKLQEYAQNNNKNEESLQSQVDRALSQVERMVAIRLDKMQARSAMSEAMKHLICGGNGLFYFAPDRVRFYPLRAFVCDRDPEGNPTEIVIRELISPDVIGENPEDGVKTLHLYTHVVYDYPKKRVEWYQEARGKRIGSGGQSRIDNSPWILLRFNRVSGEAYGRGFVEEVIGDLNTLEALSKALAEGNLMGSKRVFLVNPNGVTSAKDISDAENGDVVTGSANDVTVLGADNVGDFSSAIQHMQLIERRLAVQFLANDAIQRDAERVTAEEIRMMAQQLDETRGGLYSVLSDELQLPMARRILYLLSQDGEAPEMPAGLVEPTIVTGVQGIGRGNDMERLIQFMTTGANIAAQLNEDTMQRINLTEYWSRLAAAMGIDTEGLIRSPKELQAMQARQQQLQLAQQLAAQPLHGVNQRTAGTAGQPAVSPAGTQDGRGNAGA